MIQLGVRHGRVSSQFGLSLVPVSEQVAARRGFNALMASLVLKESGRAAGHSLTRRLPMEMT